jgi:hypothetical protein
MFGADLSYSVDTISSEGRPPNSRKSREGARHSIARKRASGLLAWPRPLPHLEGRNCTQKNVPL